jgi:hypothetical protein
MAASFRTASFTSKCFYPFFDNDRYHYQSCDWISPPPTEYCIEQQSSEQDSGKVYTEFSLFRICSHCSTTYILCHISLRTRKQRHDYKRGGGKNNSRDAFIGRLTMPERSDGVIADICSNPSVSKILTTSWPESRLSFGMRQWLKLKTGKY